MILTNSNNTSRNTFFRTRKSYQEYKKSVKKSINVSIKNKPSLLNTSHKSRKSRGSIAHNPYNNNNNLGKEIIISYKNSAAETISNLKSLIIKNIDNIKFTNYQKHFIPFDKNKQGNSGAVLGYIKNDPKTIIKFFYHNNNKQNYDSLFKSDTCVQIKNNLNEVFLNNIFNNLNSLNVFTENELNDIKPYILRIKDSGFSDKGTYILLPFIGFELKTPNIQGSPLTYVTNFTEIISLNHKIVLDKAYKTQNKEIINLYDEYLALLLNKFIYVLRLLQKGLEYINTDLKLNNIFISRKINNNHKFHKLKSYGFDIDFQLLVCDLDKSIIKINGIKSIAISDSPFKVMLAKTAGMGLIYHVRYQCISDFEEKCKKFKTIDYDSKFISYIK